MYECERYDVECMPPDSKTKKIILPEYSCLPVVLSGYSGSGKDSVANRAIEQLGQDHYHKKYFQTLVGGADHRDDMRMTRSKSRYTDRQPREGEKNGEDGRFVSREEFEAKKKISEFFYSYRKKSYGGVHYGFSRSRLAHEIENHHTFVVGGEISTAVELAQAIENQKHEISAETRGRIMILSPLLLFVNRPKEDIIRGIENRAASEEEKTKRIRHVQENWRDYPLELTERNNLRSTVIWNLDLNRAAEEVIIEVIKEYKRQVTRTMSLRPAPIILKK